MDFKEAVKRLCGNGFKRTEPAKADPSRVLSVKDKKLLARVVGHYQHALGGQDTRGLTYLQKRGITDNQSFKDFGAGYADGTLLQILPEDPDMIRSLKKIGILNAHLFILITAMTPCKRGHL